MTYDNFADQFPGVEPPRPPRTPRLDPRRGLPRLPIMWTLDQVAAAFNMSVDTLTRSYLWLEGRDTGAYRRRYLRAVNLARGGTAATATGGRPKDDWRVPEGELLRWMHHHRLWLYTPEALGLEGEVNIDTYRDLHRAEHDGKVYVTPPKVERVLDPYAYEFTEQSGDLDDDNDDTTDET